MYTVFWIIFIALILFGVFMLGGFFWLATVLYVNAEVPEEWDKHMKPLLEDMRDWVDKGNKITKYPSERIEKFLYDS